MDPAKRSAVQLAVEDKKGVAIPLVLYNQVDQNDHLKGLSQARNVFPKGSEFGIKNPFKKVLNGGALGLRNDNP